VVEPYPLVNIQKAIEHGHRKRLVFSLKKMGDFSIVVYLPPLKNNGVKVSWDDDSQLSGKHHVPNHQSVIIIHGQSARYPAKK